MICCRALLPACAAALATATASAQSADSLSSVAPALFLEKAYFSLGTPSGKHLLFEGQPTVHYFFINTLSNESWQANGGTAWAVPVTAAFMVRMTRDGVRLQNGELSTSEPSSRPAIRSAFAASSFTSGARASSTMRSSD